MATCDVYAPFSIVFERYELGKGVAVDKHEAIKWCVLFFKGVSTNFAVVYFAVISYAYSTLSFKTKSCICQRMLLIRRITKSMTALMFRYTAAARQGDDIAAEALRRLSSA